MNEPADQFFAGDERARSGGTTVEEERPLPRTPPGAPARLPASEREQFMRHQRGLQVLLIGERATFVDPLAHLLQLDGHWIAIVPDATAARKRVQGALPDAVFLDADLPGLDGTALVQQIQGVSAWRRPFLIALTAQENPTVGESYLRAGADLYLAEPIVAEEVRALLRRFQRIVQDLDAFDPII